MRRLPAYSVYLVMEGALALFFSVIFTASSVYQVTMAGLSPLQLVLVGTVLELSVFLFEIPTGVVADVFSRRMSIIIGMFLIGLGFVVEGSFPVFWWILLAQVLWGVGYTFTSGATQAWITDEIGEAAAARAFLRSNQFGQFGGLVGIGAGILLGRIQINLPILIGGLLVMGVGIFLILFMPETGFCPAPREERNSWQQMAHTFREGLSLVRGRPALMNILGIGLIYGLYSEGLDRLWTKHLLENFAPPFGGNLQPVVWIGMLRAVGMLLSIGAAELAQRKVRLDDRVGVARALLVISATLLACLLSFALSPWLVVVVVAYWLVDAARDVIGPIYEAWVNQGLDSQVRATVLSMSSQVDAIGQIAGGPAIGLIGNLVSVRAALTASGLIFSPVLVLTQRVIRKGEQVSPG